MLIMEKIKSGEISGKEYRPVEGILDGDLDHLMSDYLRELSCHTESN
jgi:hypothetical protein